MRLLFVSSNPTEAGGLGIESEVREIQKVLETVHPGEVVAEFKEKVDHQDWPNLLRRIQPDCLHISAHGEHDLIMISDYKRRPVPLSAEALGTYVSSKPPRLVFLNACDSASVASGLTEYVDLAIGCSTPIKNYMARHGVVIFYQYLLAGESVQSAFNVCQAHLRTASAKEYEIELHARNGVNPAKVRLCSRLELLAKFSGRNAQEGYNIVLGARGYQNAAEQVVFFTDDAYRFADLDRPLEPQLCKVARAGPTNDVIWADTAWYGITSDARFHCACSGSGPAQAASASLSEALTRHYDDDGGPSRHATEYAMITALRDGLLQ